MDASAFANQVIESCASTNDLARVLGEKGFPHGTWVSARKQESGRGRLGRKWESIEGNLFFSMVVRLSEKRVWTWVPLAAAVTVASAIREKFQKLSVQIKWPNDLWLNRAKLGGILCEAVGNRHDSFIIIGVGLNCVESPKGLDQEATSLSEVAGKKITADDVRESIRSELIATMELLGEHGPQSILERFENWAALPKGTPIEWQKSGGITVNGKVEGLGQSGELLVLNSEGERVRLFAEDVKIRAARKADAGSPV